MNVIRDQLPYTLDKFDASDLGKHYKGKVRDNYYDGNKTYRWGYSLHFT